ncbi:MAG: Polysulfide reductase, NrfD [Actinomycetia bacterium]|nr:Polysulfide reductase, NrfD [Actinomycetes bacterium]
MSRPGEPGGAGDPGSAGNGHEPGLAARVRERWGVHGRGQHERDQHERDQEDARSVDMHDGVRQGGGRDSGGRDGGGRAGGGRPGGGRRGEQLVVPRAQPDSYYGKPIIKEPVWHSPEVPGYLFLGGLAGASSVLAGYAQAAGNHRQAQVSKIAAVGAVGLSTVALVADLGRPERFVNMLRVFKPSSPMSVGSWLLSGLGGAATASAASAVTGRLPRAGAAATVGAMVLGPGVCTYTAALICDTAVPAWHEAHREMPYMFAGSAASAAGGLGMLAVPGHAGQATRFAALGAVAELTAKHLMLGRLGETAEPYRTGRPGRLLDAAEALTVAGAAGAVLGGRSRVATAICGAALLTASALTRFGVFEAGRASARDPKYTVRPQRERLAAKARERVP